MTRREWVAGAALAANAAQEPVRLPHKVRLALIGIEGHTGEIFGQLPRLPDIELVAVADPEQKPRGRMAQAHLYRDWRELLDREKPEMVSICGPNGSRAEIIVACAERKMHVVAEKPLAIEKADLERVRRAVESSGIRLTMLLPMRFAPPYLAMKQIVDSGQVGEVAQIGAQKSYKLGERPEWMRKRATFGGTIPYIGVHMVDLMRFTSGRDLVEVVAFQNRIGFPELADIENTTATLFKLDNGGTGALRMDYLRPETAPTHGDDRLRLAGTEGIVEVQEGRGVILITRKEKPRVVTELPPGRSLFIDFLESVYLGKPVGLTWKDIMRVNEIVLAARESADRHQLMKT